MQNRTRFVKYGAALVCAFALLSSTSGLAAQNPVPQTPLPGSNIPQFVQPLPLLGVQGGPINTIVATSYSDPNNPLQLSICEFTANILPANSLGKNTPAPATWVWGYWPGATCPDPSTPRGTYLGPVLVNVKGTPTAIRFTNALPTVDKTKVVAYKYSTDQTLHWADPLNAEANMCNMMGGDPPQVGVGIPPYNDTAMQCSFNFGEFPINVFNPVGIPAVPHLHGGEVPAVLDGGPDAWFTSDGLMKGHDFYSYSGALPTLTPSLKGNEAIYRYPNSQGASPIWFHDHTLGATRLNVYAGIAGGYYILDPNLENYLASINMPPVTQVIPLILQDRQFDTTGQLYFPTDFPGGLNGPTPNPQHPYWIPEFLGDTIVVNGKAWPYLNVQPKRYRFLFLNGSNARTYETFLVNPTTKVMGPVMWVIGNDGGFLDYPSIVDPNAAKPTEPHLIIMPGERYEVIVDFSRVAGQTLVLKNVGKAPYPGGAAPQGTSTGQLLQFRVAACPAGGCPSDTSYDPASGGALRPMTDQLTTPPTWTKQPLVRLTTYPANGTLAPGVSPTYVRELTLNEVALAPQTTIDPVTGLTTAYPGGPVEILVNNTKWSGKSPRTYGDFTEVRINGISEFVSETPREGDTEIWEIVNTTMDAHPIHTHLFTFQLLNRQSYGTKGFNAAYWKAFPGVAGNAACPAGVYCPAFGPPLTYNTGLLRTVNGVQIPLLGGNPDVTPYLANAISLPDPDEVGWKDTVMAPPGMVTRMVVRFAPTEVPVNAPASALGYPFAPNDGTNGAVGDSHGYVWHCHIIDHEDNEMMRPDVFLNNPSVTRTYVKGVNY